MSEPEVFKLNFIPSIVLRATCDSCGSKVTKVHTSFVDPICEACFMPGWYFSFCNPAGLPESDPIGPYESEEKARIAIHQDMDEEDL